VVNPDTSSAPAPGVPAPRSAEGYAWRPGALLYWRRWEAETPRATAVIVHGLGEHGGRYAHLAGHLAAWGVSSLAVDGRGFGRSSGQRGQGATFAERLADVAWAIAQQRACHPDLPLILFGHSMGGLIATRYVQRERPAPDLLVLSGPAIDPRAFDSRPLAVKLGRALARLLPGFRIPFATLHGLSTDPTVAEAARRDPLWVHGLALGLGVQLMDEAVRAWGELGTIRLPVLLLHGENDPLVPVAATRDAAPRLGSSDVTVHIYPEMLHEVFNERHADLVFADLHRWLDTHQ
jgi:alpha-beta hydrolase superfamily lysophospholipase